MSRIKKIYDQHWGDDISIEKFCELLLGAQNSWREEEKFSWILS